MDCPFTTEALAASGDGASKGSGDVPRMEQRRNSKDGYYTMGEGHPFSIDPRKDDIISA